MTCNSRYSKNDFKPFDITIDSASGGAGSPDKDKIIFCKICVKIGYPHEPIIFRKINITQIRDNDDDEIGIEPEWIDKLKEQIDFLNFQMKTFYILFRVQRREFLEGGS